jgi:hypothetical protein
VEANSTGGQGSRRAVAPSDDDDDVSITSVHWEPSRCMRTDGHVEANSRF